MYTHTNEAVECCSAYERTQQHQQRSIRVTCIIFLLSQSKSPFTFVDMMASDTTLIFEGIHFSLTDTRVTIHTGSLCAGVAKLPHNCVQERSLHLTNTRIRRS